jgi:hypothetical protein
MYKLQWTKIEKGTNINDFKYKDTVFEYEDYDEAMQDRIMLMAQNKNIYVRIVYVKSY